MTTTMKILSGPGGMTLKLEKSPPTAMVQYRGCTADYWAACDTAEVGDGHNVYGLSPEQCQWLWTQEDDLMKFLFE